MHSTLVELLCRRALEPRDRPAYMYLKDGETEDATLTYGELHRWATIIGAMLQSQGATGERVLLLYPPGLDYIAAFFGCLYAGAIAVPAYPPRSNRALFRLKSIIVDAQPAIALTTSSIYSRATSLLEEFKSLRLMVTDNLHDEPAVEWRAPAITSQSLAFIQYTSGSTAAPKGVMVSHANLLHNQGMIQRAFRQTEHSIIMGWLPLYHDMGLIGNVIQPLYLGAQCVLMSPAAFLQRPFRWLQAISHYRATTSGGPNSAYDLCVRKISAEERATLDLREWCVAFNGAEPVRADTLQHFTEAFEPCGFRRESFYPCYGMAEATLLVSGSRKTAEPVIKTVSADALENNRVSETPGGAPIVSCGESMEGQEVVIVNPESLKQCAPSEIGEIWVSGPGITGGYWNREVETRETFQTYLADTGEGPFLRSGDLGFLQDGNLFVTGRLKDLIIIRGLNHYPQDIELTVERSLTSLPAGGGAAFSIETEGEERLVFVQEVERRDAVRADDVIETIRQAVAENHEIEVYAVALIKRHSIPKTSSGKIQRHACRLKFLEGSLEIVEQWQESMLPESIAAVPPPSLDSEEAIRSWLATELAKRIGRDTAKIDVNQPLTQYGVDSLKVVELAYLIETNLGITLSVASLLRSPSIAEIATRAMQSRTGGLRSPQSYAQEEVNETPLSYGQQALWFFHRLSPDSAAYHIAGATRIHNDLDVAALRRAFQSLVDRHPSLRTIFTLKDGEPVQRILPHVEVCFRQQTINVSSDEALNDFIAEEAQQPFNLMNGPLLRVTLLTRSPQEQILVVVVHHIVADFWSLALLVHELSILYRDERSDHRHTLAPLKFSYADYVVWQKEMLASRESERLLEYWQKQLGGELPVLALSTDRPRPPIQTYSGASHTFNLGADLIPSLKQLSRHSQATLYMTLLAAFQCLLHRYTSQDDILVASPSSGRSHVSFSGVIGYFVNPLVLRADFSNDPKFVDFLSSVRQTVLDAFEHQEYPFSLLVEHLRPRHDPSRSPIAQAMFVFQKTHLPDQRGLESFALGSGGVRIKLGELELESLASPLQVAQFDLTLTIAEIGEELAASLNYNTHLFDAATIARMGGHFQTLLKAVVTDPQQRISALPLLTASELNQSLGEWNNTRKLYAVDRLVSQLFELQAERTPNAVAIVSVTEELTYAQLNARANQLARYIQKLGVIPETLVALFMERSAEMIVAVLGILKAGGGYVPLDPMYPKERLNFILDDARVPVVLTQQSMVDKIPEFGGRIVCLDSDWESIAREEAGNLVNKATPSNLAYCIYTSGTTGQPKGVMIQHGSMLNLLRGLQDAVYPHHAVAQLRAGLNASLAFDASVQQILVLVQGHRLYILPDTLRRDSRALLSYIEENKLDLLDCTPSHLEMWSAAGLLDRLRDSLALLLIGGEPISQTLWDALRQPGKTSFYNVYGPTECTVDTTISKICDDTLQTNIGRPLVNTTVYVLDKHLHPVPIGVPGELHIGGAGLARGYLNRPDLTATNFLPNPYSEEPGARLYKTGDLVRYLPDGNIELLGRLDRQVKIRGFRIELEEIKALLEKRIDIRQAFLLVRNDQLVNRHIVAYLVPATATTPTSIELRNYLKQNLPDYMVPSAFVIMAALPLTPNGKVDPQALPAPGPAELSTGALSDNPTNTVDAALAEIFAQYLGLERVGIYDNFFELGGHSLLATQMISQLQEIFQIETSLTNLFWANPTVAGLALAVTENSNAEGGAEKIVQMLTSIMQLSDEEVDALLQEP